MTSTSVSTWRAQKLAFISLLVSVTEVILLLCISVFATHPLAHSVHSVAIKRLIAAAVLLLGPVSIMTAFVGIFADSRKSPAIFAVFVAAGCWFVCILQTLV